MSLHAHIFIDCNLNWLLAYDVHFIYFGRFAFFFLLSSLFWILKWNSDYITNRRPLGGLLLLLPQKSNEKIVGEIKKLGINNKEAVMRNILVELEQLLIHANIPVSESEWFFLPSVVFNQFTWCLTNSQVNTMQNLTFCRSILLMTIVFLLNH